MRRQQATHCKPLAVSPRVHPLRRHLPYLPHTYYHIKAQRILAEVKRGEAMRGVAAAEQTNLMPVHNDTNLNDNARCVCLQD